MHDFFNRALAAPLSALALVLAARGASLAGEVPAAPEPELRRFSVRWTIDARVRGAVSVFAHPTVPGRAAVSTGDGFLLTRDAGATWAPLPSDAARKLGRVNDCLFLPSSADAFYVSTEDEGLWVTGDGGREFRLAGSEERGMASDSVLAARFYPDDPRFRTILASHGEKAPGISRSDDGGVTWRVIARGYHVRKLLFARWSGRPMFFMIASKKNSPEVLSIWTSPGLSEFWYEIVSDVLATDGAASTLDRAASYWTSLDGGLLRLVTSWSAAEAGRTGPADSDEWASVGVTCGSRPGAELVYAYEPRRLGLVVSEDGFKTWTNHRNGLLVGPYVREGACVRANANGSVFFAAVNGRLYVGRVGGGRALADVEVAPPVVSYARQAYVDSKEAIRRIVRELPRRSDAAAEAKRLLWAVADLEKSFGMDDFVVRARVPGAADTGPASVTLDLRPLGGARAEPMHDDGRHGDGRAGDGVYGAKLRLVPAKMVPDRWNHQKDVAGRIGLWVTAVGEGGGRASAPAVLSALRRRESFVFWNERGGRVAEAEGAVSLEEDRTPGAAREGDVCLKITAGPDPWRVSHGDPYRPVDLTGFRALSLWVRGEAPAGSTLNLHIADSPENTFPTVSPPIRIAEGGEKDGWRRVAVPIARLLEGAKDFQPSQTTYVVFSGDGAAAATWRVDDVRFFLSEEDLAADVERERKLTE